MGQGGELNRAENLFRRRDFAAAAEAYRRLLYRLDDNTPLYGRLGVCFLMRGDLGQAEHWFGRLLDHDPTNAMALCGQAYIDLRTDRERSALVKYAGLVKAGWQKRRIMAILDRLKDEGTAAAQSTPIHFFLPGPDFSPGIRWKKPLLAAVGFLTLAALAAGLALWQPWTQLAKFSKPGAEGGIRPGSSAERLKEIYLFDGLTVKDPNLSSSHLVALFDQTKQAIARSQVNQARINVNRVLQSDANLLIKEKFRLLEAAIPDPTFGSFENTLALAEALRDPSTRLTWWKFVGEAGTVKTAGRAWLFDFTFVDRGETHTAEVLFEKSPGLSMETGHRYMLLMQMRGFDSTRKKIQMTAAVAKEIITQRR